MAAAKCSLGKCPTSQTAHCLGCSDASSFANSLSKLAGSWSALRRTSAQPAAMLSSASRRPCSRLGQCRSTNGDQSIQRFFSQGSVNVGKCLHKLLAGALGASLAQRPGRCASQEVRSITVRKNLTEDFDRLLGCALPQGNYRLKPRLFITAGQVGVEQRSRRLPADCAEIGDGFEANINVFLAIVRENKGRITELRVFRAGEPV